MRGGGVRRIAAVIAFIGSTTWCAAQNPAHRRYTIADGLPSNTIYSALQDRDGFMWFGTDAGAVRFDGTKFRTYGVREGLTDNNVIKVAQDSEGRVWFLTLNGKLCYVFNDTVHNGRTDPELALYESPNGWATFVEDRDGMLWFGSIYHHVLRLDLDGGQDSLWTFPAMKPSVVLDDDQRITVVATGDVFKFVGDQWAKTGSLPTPYHQVDVLRGFDGRGPPIFLSPTGILALGDGQWVPFWKGSFEHARNARCWIDAAGDSLGEQVRRRHRVP